MSADQGPNAETPDPDSGHGGEIAQESARRDPLDPWAALPRFSGSQLRLAQRINRWTRDHVLTSWLDWLEPRIGTRVEIGPPEILRRASGLRRPGLIVQFRWPAMGTRLAIGLEVPLAHSIVDRLLGYDRPLSESRLQLTPVEWGVWTYLVVRILDSHLPGPPAIASNGTEPAPWPLEPLDVLLDRVSPDPFDSTGLGPIATLRWPVRVGPTAGAARVWLPERLLDLVPELRPREASGAGGGRPPSAGNWSALWRCRGRLRGDAPRPRPAADRRGLAPGRLAARGHAAEPVRADRPGVRPDRRRRQTPLPGRAGGRDRGPARSLDGKDEPRDLDPLKPCRTG